jgi:hypothetical protein
VQQEFNESKFLLGIQYGFGLGVEKDHQLALAYIDTGKDAIEKLSQSRLSEFHGSLFSLYQLLGNDEKASQELELVLEHVNKVCSLPFLLNYFRDSAIVDCYV